MSPTERLQVRVMRSGAKPGDTILVCDEELKLYLIEIGALNKELGATDAELLSLLSRPKFLIDGVWITSETLLRPSPPLPQPEPQAAS